MKFFKCETCGNIIGLINDAGIPMICCGKKMPQLIANTVDASKEKHVPVVAVNGNVLTVSVGSVNHPMVDEHYIQWIYLETEKGGQRKSLNPGELPVATFALDDDRAIAAYEYCNLHGLWKTEIK